MLEPEDVGQVRADLEFALVKSRGSPVPQTDLLKRDAYVLFRGLIYRRR